MYDETNKRLYITEQYGLSIHEVAECLHRATLDLGSLCGDKRYDSTNNEWVDTDRINKWSRYKPIRCPVVGKLTESQFAQYNFGFCLDATDDDHDPSNNSFNFSIMAKGIGLSQNGSLGKLMTRALYFNAEWPYMKPRGLAETVASGEEPHGSDEWFRLLDFAGPYVSTTSSITGYDGNAIEPYYVESDGFDDDIGGTLSINCVKRDTSTENTQIQIEDFGALGDYGNLSYFHLGALVRYGSTTKFYEAQETIATALQTSRSLNVTIDLPEENRDIKVLFVASTIDPYEVNDDGSINSYTDDDEAMTIWLSGCKQTYSISAIYNSVTGDGGYSGSGTSDYFFSLVQTADYGTPQSIQTSLKLTNGLSDEKSVDVYMYLRYPDGQGGTVVSSETVSITDNTVSPGASNYLTVTFPATPHATPSPISTEESYSWSNVEVKLYWTYTHRSRRKNRYFNFSTGLTTSSDPGFVSVSSLVGTYAFVSEEV